MSDFDKEAERERLREKYERDQQKREASERMSDLLLKGATMTNSHCGNCGDPIFRYDGDEFCPTCQQVVTSDEAAEDAAEDDQQGDASEPDSSGLDETGPDADNDDAPDHIEIKQPDGPAVQTGADRSDEPAVGAAQSDADAAGADASSANGPDANTAATNATSANASDASQSPADPAQSRTTDSTQSQPTQPRQTAQSDRAAPEPSDRQPSTDRQSPPAGPEIASSETAGDFGAARASLVRTLRNHTERAENCDDPRRARDHLTAAREAAEALSALSGSY